MNEWSISLLNQVLNILKLVNVSTEVFDYLRIVDLNHIKYENTARNVLYFLTYSDDTDMVNGFITKPFDLRRYANKIMRENPSFTFLMDMETYESLLEENKTKKIIVVDNILDAINKLYVYIINNRHPKVISVTGSVGKTTTVGLIENVLKQKYEVLRIYSKRITPIVLKANLINRLIPMIEYIVTEVSIYYPNHVEKLCEILKPDIALLLNIDTSHLENFTSLEDICIHKASIFKYASIGLYNSMNPIINRLSLKKDELYYDETLIDVTNLKYFSSFIEEFRIQDDCLLLNGRKLKLFFNSSLTIFQILASYQVGRLCQIPESNITESISLYNPVENRLQTQIVFGKEVIFDADITTNERMKQLASNNYNPVYLIIRKFGSMENDKRFENVLDYFNSFDKVFVFSDLEYLSLLAQHSNVQVVNDHTFMNELDGTIIYHYSGYYRSYEDFDENNLHVVENDIYKVKVPTKYSSANTSEDLGIKRVLIPRKKD